MTIKEYLQREAAEYMAATDMSPAERQDLIGWIRDGNSVYDNPWLMTDESGCLMDYVQAMRTADDLKQQHFEGRQ